MYKLLVPFAMLLALVGVSVLSDRPQPRADFVFINGSGEVNTLDLQRMSWMQDLRAARILFEGLVRNDVFTHDYEIIPAIATRWDISEDGRRYTFHLRDDARWSNGSPVTAHDFVYSWRRGMLPDTAAPYTKFFQLIKGSEEFYNWRNDQLEAFTQRGFDSPAERREAAETLWEETLDRFEEMVSLRAPDNHTLEVELYYPAPYFLDVCAFAVLYPVYPPLLERYRTVNPTTGRVRIEPGWTKPPILVTNGPFKLTTWRFRREMRAEVNPYYWDRDNIHIDSIAMPVIEDPNAQALAFETGAVDWVSSMVAGYAPEMLKAKHEFYLEHWDEYQRLLDEGHDQFEIDRRLPPDPRKNIHSIPAFATYWYNFNCLPNLPDGRENPFHDPRVRRAFAKAIDKETIVRDVRRNGEPVAHTLIPPGSIPGYESPEGLRFNPERARELLREAGWHDPSRMPTVELMFNRDAGHDLIAQAIARDWQRHLGVSVSLAQKELRVYRDDLKNANFITSRAGWYGDFGDPSTFLELNRTGDGNNDRKYSNPEYDRLLDLARNETDPEKRFELYTRAERIIVEQDLPMVPLFHYVTIYLFDAERISGLNPHSRSLQMPHLVNILGDGRGPDTPLTMPRTPRAGDGHAAATEIAR